MAHNSLRRRPPSRILTVPALAAAVVLFSACGAAGTWAESVPVAKALAPSSAGDRLGHVACPALNFCLAVGSYQATGGTRSLVETWNGTAWALGPEIEAPAGLTPDVQSVACTGVRCVAVGAFVPSAGTPPDPALVRPLLREWANGTWQAPEITVPTPAGLAKAACAADGWCTAIGVQVDGTGRPVAGLAFQSDGGPWTAVDAPTPPAELTAARRAFGCGSRTACVLAVTSGGTTTVETWNGSGWAGTATPALDGSPVAIHDLSCIAERCSGVGTSATNKSVFLTRTGATWATVDAKDRAFTHVSCGNADACVAVGDGSLASARFRFARWDGREWKKSDVKAADGVPAVYVNDVGCHPTGCHLVGSATDGKLIGFRYTF